VNDNEYKASTGDIFVTVNEGDDLVTLTDKAALYIIPADKTEAEVIDALQMRDDDQTSGKIKGRSGLVLEACTKIATDAAFTDANQYKLTNTVEFGADGNAITVATDQSMRFKAAANTYAFVYTKTASTGDGTVFYEARDFADFATGETKYHYAYVATTKSHTDDKGTVETTDDVDYFDAQKGVKYYTTNGADAALMTPFIGQGVSNLYLDDQGNTIAKGYAVSGVKYYYTTDGGQHYTEAHNVPYNETNSLTGLYQESTTPGTYVDAVGTQPEDGKAYYYKNSEDKYIYCVFLPQQMNGKYVLDENKANCVVATETAAVGGQTYFEKYIQNNGVYYAKIIKVQ